MGSGGLKPAHQACGIARQRYKYAPPAISRPILRWFLRYAQFYVSRHLHSVRVSREENLQRVTGRPLLLYMNHPSWWDPMIAAVLAARYLPDYLHYTPIDATALEKYRFFGKIGFFGVSRKRFASQRRLLDVGAQVLCQGKSALWITPQARFSDVRERPLRIEAGLPHLVRHAPNCAVLPIAIEYAFWEESKPEALVRFGEPLTAEELQVRPDAQEVLELRLDHALQELGEASVRRDDSAFRIILSGKSGVGGVYDIWRRAKALVVGDKFHPEHGESRH